MLCCKKMARSTQQKHTSEPGVTEKCSEQRGSIYKLHVRHRPAPAQAPACPPTPKVEQQHAYTRRQLTQRAKAARGTCATKQQPACLGCPRQRTKAAVCRRRFVHLPLLPLRLLLLITLLLAGNCALVLSRSLITGLVAVGCTLCRLRRLGREQGDASKGVGSRGPWRCTARQLHSSKRVGTRRSATLGAAARPPGTDDLPLFQHILAGSGKAAGLHMLQPARHSDINLCRNWTVGLPGSPQGGGVCGHEQSPVASLKLRRGPATQVITPPPLPLPHHPWLAADQSPASWLGVSGRRWGACRSC